MRLPTVTDRDRLAVGAELASDPQLDRLKEVVIRWETDQPALYEWLAYLVNTAGDERPHVLAAVTALYRMLEVAADRENADGR